MTIRTKLFISLTLILAIAGILCWYAINLEVSRTLTSHAKGDVENTLEYANSMVLLYVDRAQSQLTHVAEDPIVISALQTRNSSELAHASNVITGVMNVSDIIENIGLFEHRNNRCILVGGDERSKVFIGTDFSERDYCKGVLQYERAYISTAYISKASNNVVIAIAVPVKDKEGTMIGSVTGTISLPELRGYLWDIQKESKIEMLDHAGTMILSTEEMITSLEHSADESTELAMIQHAVAQGKLRGSFVDDGTFVGYKSDGPFTLIYEKPLTVIDSLERALSVTIAVVVLLILFFALLSAWYIVQSVTKRLEILTTITKEISEGNFDSTAHAGLASSNDDVGRFAKALILMADKLKDLYKTLDTKVKERTAELDESRKKMEEALEQSEKMNKLMIGRELEMIKLKQQLSEKNQVKSDSQRL